MFSCVHAMFSQYYPALKILILSLDLVSLREAFHTLKPSLEVSNFLTGGHLGVGVLDVWFKRAGLRPATQIGWSGRKAFRVRALRTSSRFHGKNSGRYGKFLLDLSGAGGIGKNVERASSVKKTEHVTVSHS